MNEQVAKDDKPYTHEEYSQFKQFLVSKNFAVADFERSIKDVKELPRILREQNNQMSVAPGKKFGIFNGSRQLTNDNYTDHVLSSGNQGQTLKSGKKNERNYYSKLLSKVKTSCASFKYEDQDMQDEIRQLPLRDCKPANKKDPNKKKTMQVLDPADSSFLVGPNVKKGGDDDDKMQVDNALVYSLESKDIIDRAIKKKPITDVYDLKYLKEVMHRQENRSNQVFRDQ